MNRHDPRSDPAKRFLGPQWEEAAGFARERGYENAQATSVPGAGHDAFAGRVVAFFASLLPKSRAEFRPQDHDAADLTHGCGGDRPFLRGMTCAIPVSGIEGHRINQPPATPQRRESPPTPPNARRVWPRTPSPRPDSP